MNAHFPKLIELTILDLDENLSCYMIDSKEIGCAPTSVTRVSLRVEGVTLTKVF